MKVPILKKDTYLIASIQAVLTDADLMKLSDELTAKCKSLRTQGVVIDVTALDLIDSFATRTLRQIAEFLQVFGVEIVIVGIQPEVAFTMVKMGLNFDGVGLALDLEEGLAYLDRKFKS